MSTVANPTAYALERLASDDNIDPMFRRALAGTQPLLAKQHVKQQARRFSAEPEPQTGFGALADDDRPQQWLDEAKADEYERERERAESYSSGGFGL